MDSADELCICFHVPFHKVAAFIRQEHPRFASQCSECWGAGTGCGWCVPFIEKLFEEIQAGRDPLGALDMDPAEYRARRAERLRALREEAPPPPLPPEAAGPEGDLVDSLDPDLELSPPPD